MRPYSRLGDPRSKREYRGRVDLPPPLFRFERGSDYSQGSRHACAELRKAEAVGFLDIEKGSAKLNKKARDGKLTIEYTVGSSFTMFIFNFFSMSTCGLDLRGSWQF